MNAYIMKYPNQNVQMAAKTREKTLDEMVDETLEENRDLVEALANDDRSLIRD